MNEFIQAVREGNYAEKGWARSCYRVSKIGINQYARVFAKEKNVVERKIQAYAMCPGWVNTDMTSYKAELTIQQGALTPVFLAELPFEVNP
jgi:NAD(P)-dependent dehydrogenase (short-subunit alcohol dehydrogenase family)